MPLNIAALLCLLLLCFAPQSYAAENPEELYRQGIEYGKQQDYDAAIASLSKALALSPDNQDYRLALARVYRWKGEVRQAHELVDETLSVQPNEEALVLKARLHYSDQAYDQAEKVLADITDNEEANEIRERIRKIRMSPASKRWVVATGLDYSKTAHRPQPDWIQQSMLLGYKFSDAFSANLYYQNSERFRTHNEYYELGASYRFSDVLNGYASAGYTAEATFIPEVRLKAGGAGRVVHDHKHFGDTWLTFDMQYDRSGEDVETKTFKPGLSYTLFDGVTLSGKSINIFDDKNNHQHGWVARLDWQTPWDRLSLNGIVSDVPESENDTIITTKSYSLGASLGINTYMTLRLSYTNDDRENLYTQDTVSSSLIFRF